MEWLSYLSPKRADQLDAAQSAALDWVLELAENPDAEADCAAWRAADPAHEKAWQEAMAVWNGTGALASLERDDWRAEIETVTRGSSFTRRAQWGLAIAATLVAALFLGWFLNLPDARYQTAVAQTREVALEDGSHLTVGASSNLELHFANDERRVVLNDGQAFFEVAHDASRPFTVVAGNAEVRVTGTKFDVRRSSGGVRVSVLEGRVEVRRRRRLPLLGSDSPARVLTAGLKSSLAAGAEMFSAPQKSVIPAGEWRSGRFFYQDAMLGEIVSDVRRYSPTPIRIADPSVARLKVTTSFNVDEIDRFLDNLTTILPVRKRSEQDGTITLDAQPSFQ